MNPTATPGLPSPQQLPHDIRGVLPYRMTLLDYLPYIAAGVAALTVALLALHFWRKRHRAIKPAEPVDPWEVLFARLAAVTPGRPFEGPAQVEFYFQLSLLLREAIERRTGVRATDSTLGELRVPLRKKLPLTPGAIEAVLAFLERSDLIKFAGFAATPDEALAAQEQVSAWARALKPLPVVTAALEQRGLTP